jgi:hypothetical protein
VAPSDEVKGQTTRSTRAATRQNGRTDHVPVVVPSVPTPAPVYIAEVPSEPTPSSRQTFPQQLGPGKQKLIFSFCQYYVSN